MIFYRLCLIGVMCLLLNPGTGAAAAPQAGVIEGSLSYPSEFIPRDMTISAENLATKKIYSTNIHLKAKKYQYKVGYKLGCRRGITTSLPSSPIRPGTAPIIPRTTGPITRSSSSAA